MQRERNVDSVVRQSGGAKLFPGVHLLISPVQVIFSVAVRMNGFNESFQRYLLPLISKTRDENP